LNSVILASLGAKVISVGASDESLALAFERARANGLERDITLVQATAAMIPLSDAAADLVLCDAVLRHSDCIATARQIRRILRPGGVAAFLASVTGPAWFEQLKSFLPRPDYVTDNRLPLTSQQVDAVSRAVGRGGRRREFTLTTRVLERIGVRSSRTLKKSQELDARILRHFPFMRPLASQWVWEARKES